MSLILRGRLETLLTESALLLSHSSFVSLQATNLLFFFLPLLSLFLSLCLFVSIRFEDRTKRDERRRLHRSRDGVRHSRAARSTLEIGDLNLFTLRYLSICPETITMCTPLRIWRFFARAGNKIIKNFSTNVRRTQLSSKRFNLHINIASYTVYCLQVARLVKT